MCGTLFASNVYSPGHEIKRRVIEVASAVPLQKWGGLGPVQWGGLLRFKKEREGLVEKMLLIQHSTFGGNNKDVDWQQVRV